MQAKAVIGAEPIYGGRTEIWGWGLLPPCPMLATALQSPDRVPNFDTDFRSGDQNSDVSSPKSKDNGSSTAMSNEIANRQHSSRGLRAPDERISSQPLQPKKHYVNIINATVADAAARTTATVTTDKTPNLTRRRTVGPSMNDKTLLLKQPDNRDLQNSDTSIVNGTAHVADETNTPPQETRLSTSKPSQLSANLGPEATSMLSSRQLSNISMPKPSVDSVEFIRFVGNKTDALDVPDYFIST